MAISRFNAVEKASNRKAVEAITPTHKVSEYYGEGNAEVSLERDL